MNDNETSRESFFNTFLSFFDKIEAITCPGKIEAARIFITTYVYDPTTFIKRLASIGIECDCKFIQSFEGLLFMDSPYTIGLVTVDNDNMYHVSWELAGFRAAIEAMGKHKAVGVRVDDFGYFPPESVLELVLNIDSEGHNTAIVLDKDGFALVGGKGSYE